MLKNIKLAIVFLGFACACVYGSEKIGKSTSQKHWLTRFDIGRSVSLDSAASAQGDKFNSESDDPIAHQYKLLSDNSDNDLEEDDTLTCFCFKLLCWKRKS